MKTKTHIYMANLLIEDLRANKIVLPNIGTFTPPTEIREAVLNNPGAFRAGSVGPDFYPDILLGQAIIHPDNSGKWLNLMFNRLLVSSPMDREKNLAFTLGYMLHYAGDMFGHAYVNSYAKGWFPDFTEAFTNIEKAKIIARHLLVETYMDQRVPSNTSTTPNPPTEIRPKIADLILQGFNISNTSNPPTEIRPKIADLILQDPNTSMTLNPPIDFIRDVFTCEEAQKLMGTSNVSINPLGYFIKLRKEVHETLLKTAIGMTPGVTDYVQRWEEDVDAGIKTWIELWANTANAFAINRSDKLTYVKALLENWFLLKFLSMVGFPDFVGKVISFINDLKILEPLKRLIEEMYKNFLIALAKAILGQTYTTIEQAIAAIEKVFKDPKTYIDNGIIFPEKNVSLKLDADFGNYGKESDTTKQTFHAVHQCLNMSKLCLIGSDNLNTVVKNALGNATVSADLVFKNFNYAAAARIGYITVKTKDGNIFSGHGTDNNVYIGLQYGNAKRYETLCDKPNYNDFERGDLDTYKFTIPENIDLSTVSALTARMSGNTPAGDWLCDWIEIKDAAYNVLFRSDDDFWLKTGNTKVITNFSRRYSIPTKLLRLDPKIISFLWSLDGKGKDGRNPTADTQWSLGFSFYTNATLRSKVFDPLFNISNRVQIAP